MTKKKDKKTLVIPEFDSMAELTEWVGKNVKPENRTKEFNFQLYLATNKVVNKNLAVP